MTPARIAALEACAEALNELVRLKRIKNRVDKAERDGKLKTARQMRVIYDRAKPIAWESAIAAVERLEGVSDDR